MATVATRNDASEIFDTGLEDIYREALDSALRLGVDALRAMGFRSHQATRSAHRFRHHEVETLKELCELRHDTKLYMSAAKQEVHDLERLQIGEFETVDENRDAGWDAESIRRDFAEGYNVSEG